MILCERRGGSREEQGQHGDYGTFDRKRKKLFHEFSRRWIQTRIASEFLATVGGMQRSIYPSRRSAILFSSRFLTRALPFRGLLISLEPARSWPPRHPSALLKGRPAEWADALSDVEFDFAADGVFAD
jgi:hypothetical protein